MVVDFVYVVYFDIGNICVGVWVECCNFSLSKLLENGQMVEIIMLFKVKLNVNWLNFVVSV